MFKLIIFGVLSGTDVVVFQRAATPKTPEASPTAVPVLSNGGVDGGTNVEIADRVDPSVATPTDGVMLEHEPMPEEAEISSPADNDSRDSESPQSHRDASENNVQKAESESVVTDESSTDELDFIPQHVPEPRTTDAKQRVVTFEDMSKQHTYRGPLITSEQLFEPKEDLSKIIFCRHFTSSVKPAGPEQERGYGEVTLAGLTDGLKHAQNLYNQQDVLPLDVVFFEEAVRHAARLSRTLVSINNFLQGFVGNRESSKCLEENINVLLLTHCKCTCMMMVVYLMLKFLLLQCLSNGNTLLLSKSGHGRKDLVFLTSFAAGCKVSFTITCLFIYSIV